MTKIASSELIINADGTIFHLHLRPEELADTVLLVGDPGRVTMVGNMLDSIEHESQSREFHAITGRKGGLRLTALSTGIGTDNIDIVINELDALANIDFSTREVKKEHRRLRLLRIGTSGAIQPDIPLGSLVYSSICLGFDGLLNWYAGRNQINMQECEADFIRHMNWLPVLPQPYFVSACEAMEQCLESVIDVKGITISAPGFYGPQGRVLRLPLADPAIQSHLLTFRYNGMRITNFEMEGSAIAGLSRLLGHDYGTICLIIAQRSQKDMNVDYKALMADAIARILNVLAQ